MAGDRWLYAIPPDPPANPLLRHEFDLPEPVASARLYLVGLGHAVAWINEKRVSDAELSPPATDYDKRVLYTTHDITSLLRRGGNAIGIALGRGTFATRGADTDGSNLARWVAEPRVRAQLEVTTASGRRVSIGTNDDWRLTEGPTTYEGLLTGESYDARRAAVLTGWTAPGFDAAGWRSASIVDSPGGKLEAHAHQPIRARRIVAPVKVSHPADGVWVYDFGVVLSGWARLSGRLPTGTTVRLRYHEKIGADGRMPVATPGGFENPSVTGRLQIDEYTAAGHGVETWEPSFSYKGFRYLEVTGTTEQLDVVAAALQSDVADTMALRLGHPVLQWIADAFRQTARNGLYGHPVIAPMYGKLGWASATAWAVQPLLYQFDMATLFAKWLDDIRLGQAADGDIPLIAPQGVVGDGTLTPASTAAYPNLVHRYWLTYGDRTVPEKHFDAVQRYVSWLLRQMKDGVVDDQFGDWYPPTDGDPRPPEGGKLVGTAHTIQTLRDATALADLLGHTDLARTWRSRTAELLRRFNEVFFDPAAGHYRTGVPNVGYRQASNAIPLAFGLVPLEHVTRVAANLAADVESRDRHLNTGSAGTSALPFALSDHGRPDLALAVLSQRDYPSYGYLRDLGATTFWESWQANSRGHNDTTISSPVRWLVERILGVEALQPGWARFRVAPRAFGSLPNASVALDTVRGRIEVSWRRAGGNAVIAIRVPVNSIAEVVLPNGDKRNLGSGTYQIETPLP